METCDASDCDRPIERRKWCRKHYERWRVHGDPEFTLLPRSDGYLAVHKRLHRARGKAKEHRCEQCGEAATQWAYDHTDPDELTGWVHVRTTEFWMCWSTDFDRYKPLCSPCHYDFDRDHQPEDRPGPREHGATAVDAPTQGAIAVD